MRAITVSSLTSAGTVLVGDFKAGATLFVREPGLEVSSSPDSEGYFLEGKLAVAAEFQGVLRIPRPSALVKITGF